MRKSQSREEIENIQKISQSNLLPNCHYKKTTAMISETQMAHVEREIDSDETKGPAGPANGREQENGEENVRNCLGKLSKPARMRQRKEGDPFWSYRSYVNFLRI
jgi:hypothetical protein